MKKLSILVFLSVFATVVVQAQVKVSLDVCPQMNESLGIRAGSDFDVHLSSRWSFVPGVYWSLRNRQNTENSTTNKTTTQTKYSDKAHFITLPLRSGLRIPCKDEETFAMKLLLGPYIGSAE